MDKKPYKGSEPLPIEQTNPNFQWRPKQPKPKKTKSGKPRKPRAVCKFCGNHGCFTMKISGEVFKICGACYQYKYKNATFPGL